MSATAGAQPGAEAARTRPPRPGQDYERLAVENEGLAEEVLRSYEQLNLIFDVTAQVATLTDAHEVEQLLCDRLREILRARGVWCAGRSEPEDELLPAPPAASGDCSLTAAAEAEIAELLDQLRTGEGGRRVAVRMLSADGGEPGAGELCVIAGPLADSNGGAPRAICAVRCGERFTAGEMMLLDSVITFGGHVLRNLQLVERLKRTSFEAVRALVAAIDKKDRYTSGHSERVGLLAKLTGRAMGLPPEDVQELEWAGLLHDIGKIGIPEAILNKPGSLSPLEYAIIKGHPQMSYDVLRPVASLSRVLVAVVQHHENYDGTGYPNRLKGEEISLAGRILHVVDVFDALTSARSYRTAYDVDRALAILRQDAGTKLDPAVVESFMTVMTKLERLQQTDLEELFALPHVAIGEPSGVSGTSGKEPA